MSPTATEMKTLQDWTYLKIEASCYLLKSGFLIAQISELIHLLFIPGMTLTSSGVDVSKSFKLKMLTTTSTAILPNGRAKPGSNPFAGPFLEFQRTDP